MKKIKPISKPCKGKGARGGVQSLNWPIPSMNIQISHTPLIGALLGIAYLPAMAAETPPGLREAVQAYTTEAGTAYRYAVTDLNGDRLPDAVVILSGKWCGSGGCNMLIMAGTSKGFRLVSSATVSNEPVSVRSRRNLGWRTLLVNTNTKGVVVMPFNGWRYPSNPAIQRVATAAEKADGKQLAFILDDGS